MHRHVVYFSSAGTILPLLTPVFGLPCELPEVTRDINPSPSSSGPRVGWTGAQLGRAGADIPLLAHSLSPAGWYYLKEMLMWKLRSIKNYGNRAFSRRKFSTSEWCHTGFLVKAASESKDRSAIKKFPSI